MCVQRPNHASIINRQFTPLNQKIVKAWTMKTNKQTNIMKNNKKHNSMIMIHEPAVDWNFSLPVTDDLLLNKM